METVVAMIFVHRGLRNHWCLRGLNTLGILCGRSEAVPQSLPSLLFLSSSLGKKISFHLSKVRIPLMERELTYETFIWLFPTERLDYGCERGLPNARPRVGHGASERSEAGEEEEEWAVNSHRALQSIPRAEAFWDMRARCVRQEKASRRRMPIDVHRVQWGGQRWWTL